jgi:peptidoglycan/xylan/chitin deacetylase (PgdA/CDA1 family)
LAVYRLARALGLFWLSRRLTRDKLRILCYHGLSTTDEEQFRPGLFMTPELFRDRMQILKRGRYPVLGLAQAVEAAYSAKLPPCAVVITFDDGFFSTLSLALPTLWTFGFPSTVYVTSYYVTHEHPIFRLAVQYMFWKSKAQVVSLSALGVPPGGDLPLEEASDRNRAAWQIIGFGETQLDEPGRLKLSTDLAAQLGIDFASVVRTRSLSLMTRSEIASAAARGTEIQLHTHRHRFGSSESVVQQEITDNRAVLEPLVGVPLRHFCYPSGEWSRDALPHLEKLDIATACTCDPGLNGRRTHPLTLKRFLDAQHVSMIEFEAELCGFSEFMRRLRAIVAARKTG